VSAHPSKGLAAVGVFLCFASSMASLAGITLSFPGTPLDRVWTANPEAYAKLLPLGRKAGILFLLLGSILAAAAVGWIRRRYWGWLLAVLVIASQVLGDVINFAMGNFLRGGIGIVIAGGLLAYLLSPSVGMEFRPDRDNECC